MKRSFFVFLASALLFSGTAFADILSVAVDAPVTFTPSDESATVNSVSGYSAGLALVVLPVGIAVEQYTVNYDAQVSTKELETQFSIVDLYFNLPIPVLNIAVGIGAGTAKTADVVESGSTITTPDASVLNFFGSVGYSVIPMFDLHLGLHVLKAGAVDVTSNGSTVSTRNVGGSMLTAGVKVGF